MGVVCVGGLEPITAPLWAASAAHVAGVLVELAGAASTGINGQ